MSEPEAPEGEREERGWMPDLVPMQHVVVVGVAAIVVFVVFACWAAAVQKGEVPAARLDHMETPSPYTQFGVKGIGEGGAIAPPAAIANAVNDALRQLGAELMQSPITPHRIVAAVLAASTAERPAA